MLQKRLVVVGVFLGKPRDFLTGLGCILPDDQMPIAGIGRKARRIALKGLVAEIVQFEIFDDLRPEQADDIRAGVDLEARKGLFGDACLLYTSPSPRDS